jgi:hypothetical protein
VQKLAAQGLSTRYLPAPAFEAFMAEERTRWGEAVRAANITVD